MKDICKYCGKEFEKKHGSQVYCDDVCRNKRNTKKNTENNRIKNEKRVRVCKNCGKEYTSRSYYYCSNECAKIAINNRQRNNVNYTKQCVVCGNEFTTIYPNKICCDKKCIMKRIKKSESYIKSKKKSRKIEREKIGKTQKKLHLRFKDSKIDYSITLKRLIKRDECICYICGEKCDINDFKEVNGTIICGNNYPSIDHVVPVAKGGTHSWDNVKLAHRICNSIKSDKL